MRIQSFDVDDVRLEGSDAQVTELMERNMGLVVKVRHHYSHGDGLMARAAQSSVGVQMSSALCAAGSGLVRACVVPACCKRRLGIPDHRRTHVPHQKTSCPLQHVTAEPPCHSRSFVRSMAATRRPTRRERSLRQSRQSSHPRSQRPTSTALAGARRPMSYVRQRCARGTCGR